MKKYRLRYAPSPTGHLHIGNARTALINYLFAKHQGGDFIVRVEDTDLARNLPGSLESQFRDLDWLGMEIDESHLKANPQYGPYIQSQKLGRYQNLAHQLVREGKAYYCFCSEDELEQDYQKQKAQGVISYRYNGRCLKVQSDQVTQKLNSNLRYSIRFKVPLNRTYTLEDRVRGSITFNSENFGDFVILKTNGIPTYNFAVVVDDHDMKISHVIRGEEHISNTPLQMMLYQALGWQAPEFGHLTLIIDSSGKKLSKRSGEELFFIDHYRKKGFLPQAIFNYIALLGWSPKTNQEIFTKSQLLQEFDSNRFSKAPSTFDLKKLTWINSQHLKGLSEAEYLKFVQPFVSLNYIRSQTDKKWWREVLLLFKDELEYGVQINELLVPFFAEQQLSKPLWEEMIQNFPNYREIALDFLNQINLDNEWNEEKIKKAIHIVGKNLKLKGKALYMPLRLMTTQQQHGPQLAKFIDLLGKNKVIANLKQSMIK